MISIKLQSSFIEITLWHRSSPVNLMNIFRTLFPMNISGWLLLDSIIQSLASIYDPLGLIAPAIVKMKILFQDICVNKFTWTEELPLEFCSKWKEILFDLLFL